MCLSMDYNRPQSSDQKARNQPPAKVTGGHAQDAIARGCHVDKPWNLAKRVTVE